MSKRINMTHAQSRERNQKFIEIAKQPQIQEQLKHLSKCKYVQYLKKICEDQYNLVMPMSAIYKVMGDIDDRFANKGFVPVDSNSDSTNTDSSDNADSA